MPRVSHLLKQPCQESVIHTATVASSLISLYFSVCDPSKNDDGTVAKRCMNWDDLAGVDLTPFDLATWRSEPVCKLYCELENKARGYRRKSNRVHSLAKAMKDKKILKELQDATPLVNALTELFKPVTVESE